MKNRDFRIRLRRPHSNPKTEFQLQTRANFAYVSRLWGQLTEEQIKTWNEFAKTMTYNKHGKTFVFKGFNLFTKLNIQLMNIEKPLYENIDLKSLIKPQDMFGASVEIITTEGDEDILLHLPEPIDKDTTIIVFGTSTLKRGREIDWNKLRKIMIIDESFKPGSSIRDKYLERFGIMPEKEGKSGFAILPVNNICGMTSKKILIVPIKKS